jgi:CRP-like cAMP-binding protein
VDATTTRSLLDLDPDLTLGLGPSETARARMETQVSIVALAPGPWSPDIAATRRRTSAFLVVDGILVRELVLAGATSSELLGPGDLAATLFSADEFLPTAVRWTVAVPSCVALLDERLGAAVQAWPSISAQMLTRAAQQISRLAVHRAIAHLPRVEDRLLALFWHLAERWGHVAPEGVIVPVALTHTMLGRLVGARRPTISLALKELERQGALTRREDGSWMAALDSLAVLKREEPETPAHPSVALVMTDEQYADSRFNRRRDLPASP